MNKIVILIGGNEYHVKVVMNVLLKNKKISIKQINNRRSSFSLIYWIFNFPFVLLIKNPINLINKTPIIIHWIGSDVLDIIESDNLYNKFVIIIIKCLQIIKRKRFINLAGAPWLVDELSSKGINAFYFPLSTLDIQKLKIYNMSKNIDFISYVPKNKFDFYGGNIILQLAKEMPSYSFKIIMPDVYSEKDLPVSCLSNLQYSKRLSFEEMQKIYQQGKCFLRLTKHDGLSLSVLEALYYKLQCVWTYEFPFVYKVDINEIDEIKKTLNKIMNNYKSNEKGYCFILNNYVVKNLENKYTSMFNILYPNLLKTNEEN